jgi:hypothetical protein
VISLSDSTVRTIKINKENFAKLLGMLHHYVLAEFEEVETR